MAASPHPDCTKSYSFDSNFPSSPRDGWPLFCARVAVLLMQVKCKRLFPWFRLSRKAVAIRVRPSKGTPDRKAGSQNYRSEALGRHERQRGCRQPSTRSCALPSCPHDKRDHCWAWVALLPDRPDPMRCSFTKRALTQGTRTTSLRGWAQRGWSCLFYIV